MRECVPAVLKIKYTIDNRRLKTIDLAHDNAYLYLFIVANYVILTIFECETIPTIHNTS